MLDDIFDKRLTLRYIGKKFRQKLDISQTELGDKLGYSQPHIGKILNGDASIKKDKLRDVAIAI